MQIKPSFLDKAQLLKVLKAAVYLGVSAVIAGLVAAIAENPDLFGPLTPIVNIVLVTLKQVFTPTK